MNRVKLSVRITAIVISAIYSVVLFLVGVKLDSWIKTLLGLLPTIATIAVVIFDAWLWKLGPIHRFLRRPLLAGTWKANLQPSAKSDITEGGNRGPIEAYFVIEQTFWSIAITLFTRESSSRSRASSFTPRPDSQGQVLSFVYEQYPSYRTPRSQPSSRRDV